MTEKEYELSSWKRHGGETVMRQERFVGAGGNVLPLLSFPLLSQCGIVSHCFTTRSGGVSTGVCSSLNLSFSRGDAPEAVTENFRRVAEAFGVTPDRIVCSMQTHTTNVRRVKSADGGAGVTYPLPWSDVGGLITDEPGVLLATFYADCVPLYFVDPVHRAIGLAHSGWRGTVNRMGAVTVRAMGDAFGTRPGELLCAIGPSICRDCYEVGEDVAGQFLREFAQADEAVVSMAGGGKYRLDLWEANRQVLLCAGVRPEHIQTTDICTCCNPHNLFSHRYTRGRRGNLGAFLMLRQEIGRAAGEAAGCDGA